MNHFKGFSNFNVTNILYSSAEEKKNIIWKL